MTFWHNHKSAILFTLKAWGAILVWGTFFWAFINAFLGSDMPVDALWIVLFFAVVFSAPYVLIFGIAAVILNKSDFELKEKKIVLAIVGTVLGFILVENISGYSREFFEALGYLIAIPISIFYYKLESPKNMKINH